MAGYNYTNKCLLSSWLVTIPLKEVFTLHDWLQEESGHFFSVIVTSHAESEHFF
jgi:hypothetical protein